jgi:hypothetical protein
MKQKLTMLALTAATGASRILRLSSVASLPNLRNPAPGIHAGTWRTAKTRFSCGLTRAKDCYPRLTGRYEIDQEPPGHHTLSQKIIQLLRYGYELAPGILYIESIYNLHDRLPNVQTHGCRKHAGARTFLLREKIDHQTASRCDLHWMKGRYRSNM